MSGITTYAHGTVTRLRRRYPLLAPAGVAAAVTALVAYVGAVDPNRPGHYPTCPYYLVTGLYCPGCGSLRMIHALAHGDLSQAFHRNMLMFTMLPVLAYNYVRWTIRQAKGTQRTTAAPAWLIWALFAVVVAFTVLRNLPWFRFLAPA